MYIMKLVWSCRTYIQLMHVRYYTYIHTSYYAYDIYINASCMSECAGTQRKDKEDPCTHERLANCHKSVSSSHGNLTSHCLCHMLLSR